MKKQLLIILFFVSIKATAQTAPVIYWQQKVDHKIEVKLDDEKHMLYAHQEMTYTNNSPDTLKFIYIHLWPNAYKHDHTPFAQQEDRIGHTNFYYAKQKERGYIDSLQFQVDGANAEHYITEDAPDIARLDLPTPLYPKHSIKITTPFKVKIPKVFSRLGHTGQAYFISQWFPKPAVYDRKGWHPISYLDQGEFFSEYGSYDVTITLPKNYVLLATGNCMDDAENNWLDQKAHDTLPIDTLYKKWFPASSKELKTVRWHEDNVHDFAWFVDKRWSLLKDTVYSPGNHQLVTTYSAFLPAYKKRWVKSNTYLKETIKHYGKWVGPYPYKTIKAVLGDMKAGGGMEYPTITVIDKAASTALKTVVVHEAGHNWFYGLLGSMERDHAWMDEGMNTFYEKKTISDFPKDSTDKKEKGLQKRLSRIDEEIIYYELAATHSDQAIDQPSANFRNVNYGLDVYYKTDLALIWLEKYMGKEDFGAAMQEYFQTWEYKHPYPEDFRAILIKHTPKNIDWFFDPVLKSDKPIDFKITKAKIDNGNTEISIKNTTHVLSPVLVDVFKGNEKIDSLWTMPFEKKIMLLYPNTDWTKLKINEDQPDYKSTNDVYRRKGLFHRFGLQIKPLVGLNTGDKDKIFIAPAFGYNQYNGFMAGLLIHDFGMPENHFKYLMAPMYGFNSNTLAGAGSVGYQWYPENIFKEILLQADVKTFDYSDVTPGITNKNYLSFVKFAPSLNFTINEHNPLSTVTRTLNFKGYMINEQTSAPSISSTEWATGKQQKMYGTIFYNHSNNRTYNPFRYSIEGQVGADFAKLNIEANYKIDYNVKNKSLYLRCYLGKFFAINNDPSVTSRYELNTTYSGINDYLYDGTYLGRTSGNGLTAHQISIQEGGFKIPVFNNVGRSDNWMATINLETDLPKVGQRYKLFFDAGLIPNPNPLFTNPSSTTFLYEGGVELQLISGIASIYIPLIKSTDFNNYLTGAFGNKNAFGRSVSFTLQFQNFNWLKSPLKSIKLG